MNNLSVSLLGSFQAVLDGEPIAQFRTKSVQALLIYLVCEAERPYQREALMEFLWPGMPQTSAQANMRQTLYRLRKLIPEVKSKDGDTTVPFLITDRQTIQINPDADCFLDVATFTSSEPAQAIALYRGDFLADFYLPDSEAFEEWASARRADYRRRVLEMMEGETAVHLQSARYDKAIKLAQRQIEIDNLRESSHRQLMEAWARNGRRREALSHYETLRQLLQDELAIEPEPETLALIEAIRAGELSRTAPIFAAPSFPTDNEPELAKHNLPQRLTSFIGRENEITTISDLISQNRLVNLTGVGGIGKTNLSLQVGQSIMKTFADGVWLVELAPITDADLLSQTTASVLGLRESGNQSIADYLLDYLQEKQCLLILDNCEHLINGVAQFVQMILQRCANVKILASSREVLGVLGERPFQVPPLTFPTNNQQAILEEWQQYESLRLFVERAQIVLPAFQVTADNAAAIVQICQRLDGIPLALELAAARMKLLTTAQIAGRLDDRFRLLTSGSRAAFPRQQTLRALIDWSWELLTTAEQRLLQRLSVFAGGMNLEAVEAICADETVPFYEMLDLLNELVNKSLVNVQRKQGEETRYYLLETIRQYGQERLTAAGETETYRHKHLVYFRQLAATAEPQLQGFQQGAWRDRLENELDNIRAALNWAHETDAIAGLELLSSLFYFVITRGYLHEMETHLTQLLAQTPSLALPIKAKALWVLGSWLVTQSHQRREEAEVLWQESLSLSYRLEDPLGITRILRLQGYFLSAEGQVERGQALIRKGVALMREAGNKAETAETLNYLYEHEPWDNVEQRWAMLQETEKLHREVGNAFGIVITLRRAGQLATLLGDFETARPFLEECLPLAESVGLRDYAHTVSELGVLYLRMGDYPLAQTTLNKAVSLFQNREIHDQGHWARLYLGYVHLRQGNLLQANQLFSQALRSFNAQNDENGICYALEGLAGLAVQKEQPEKAVTFFAWADVSRKNRSGARPPVEQDSVDKDIARIREIIGEEAYAIAYAQGQAMTMAQAIAYAIEDEGLV